MARFGRQYRLTVGPVQVTGLSVQFKVKKTKKAQPNTLEAEVINLNPRQRQALSELSVIIPDGTDKAKVRGRIPCVLEAGYDTMEVIFAGNLRTAIHKHEGTEWTTKFEGGDAGTSFGTSRIQRAFPAGTPVPTVVRACVEAMGIGEGNLRASQPLLRTRHGQLFEDGTTLFGKASDELRGVLASCGLTYSVQNGVLQIQKAGTVVRAKAVRLSAFNGLIGSLSANPDGTVRARALLTPGLVVGGIVELAPTDGYLAGQYEILRIEYSGQLTGKEWYAEMDLLR